MDDLISRQAAINVICKHGTELERRGITVLSVVNHKQATVALLEELPSAERHGRWNKTGEKRYYVDMRYTDYEYECSCCGKRKWSAEIPQYNYCPNCGARMEE